MSEKYFDPENIPEKEKSEPVVISDLKEAINSGDKDKVMESLGVLDKKLTRSVNGAFAEKPDASYQEVGDQVADFLKEFSSDSGGARLIVFLGDGGYSRLMIDKERDGSIYIGLTSNASEDVRKEWDKLE